LTAINTRSENNKKSQKSSTLDVTAKYAFWRVKGLKHMIFQLNRISPIIII